MINKDVIVRFLIDKNVLEFGDFELKSGEKSLFFYNFGALSGITDYLFLGNLMLNAVDHEFDCVFTSAYKGILLSSAFCAQYDSFRPDDNLKLGYLRKEAKDHGERGNIIGYCPKDGDRVLLIDDVLTSGQSLLEIAQFVRSRGATVSGAAVVVDRSENVNLDFPVSSLISHTEVKQIIDTLDQSHKTSA